MGKIFVLSVTDHEEYILSRIMEIIAAEPGFDHIVSSHPCNTLVFPSMNLIIAIVVLCQDLVQVKTRNFSPF